MLTKQEREEVRRISNCLKTQNEYSNKFPVYLVETSSRVYGITPGYTHAGSVFYYGDQHDESVDSIDELISNVESCGEIYDPTLVTEIHYNLVWNFRAVFFTLEEAEEFMENSSNKNNLRINIQSGWKSNEWQTIRDIIMSLAERISNE